MTALEHPTSLGRQQATDLTPVRKQVEVACAPDRAFDIFTNHIAEWWPLATHSVYRGDATDVTFGKAVGEEITETSRTGESCSWGKITVWEPGHRLVFDWYPGVPLDQVTSVEVTFTQTAAGTLVELVHSGWEQRDEPAERRAGYDVGWISVVIRYAARASDIAV